MFERDGGDGEIVAGEHAAHRRQRRHGQWDEAAFHATSTNDEVAVDRRQRHALCFRKLLRKMANPATRWRHRSGAAPGRVVGQQQAGRRGRAVTASARRRYHRHARTWIGAYFRRHRPVIADAEGERRDEQVGPRPRRRIDEALSGRRHVHRVGRGDADELARAAPADASINATPPRSPDEHRRQRESFTEIRFSARLPRLDANSRWRC